MIQEVGVESYSIYMSLKDYQTPVVWPAPTESTRFSSGQIVLRRLSVKDIRTQKHSSGRASKIKVQFTEVEKTGKEI